MLHGSGNDIGGFCLVVINQFLMQDGCKRSWARIASLPRWAEKVSFNSRVITYMMKMTGKKMISEIPAGIKK